MVDLIKVIEALTVSLRLAKEIGTESDILMIEQAKRDLWKHLADVKRYGETP